MVHRKVQVMVLSIVWGKFKGKFLVKGLQKGLGKVLGFWQRFMA